MDTPVELRDKPNEHGCSIHGDACLYIGMYAHMDPSYVPHILACQDENGRIWRNPEEAKNQESPYDHGTSRDMLSGFLLGCVDQPEAVAKLGRYLKKHRRLSPSGDGRTNPRLTGWAKIGMVLKKHKYPILKNLGFRGWLYYKISSPFMQLVNLIEALTVWKGYQLHLVMVAVLFQRALGIKDTYITKLLIKVLDERSPHNHLVSFIKGDLAAMKFELPHDWNRHRDIRNVYKDSWIYADFSHVDSRRMISFASVKFLEMMIKRLESK